MTKTKYLTPDEYALEDYEIINAMETYGGSFVKALAVCFRLADYNNLIILKKSFAKYWAEYARFIVTKRGVKK